VDPSSAESPENPSGTGLTCFWLGDEAGSGRFMLVGTLDLVTAGRAREALRRAQDGRRELTCDLGDVWFVDLSGLRVLLDAASRARLTGARLTIASCPPIVPRMLELLELRDALDVQRTARPAAPPAPRMRSSVPMPPAGLG
jgi:anti-anti-sigma factor